jgi:hypothetical protein
MSKNLALLIAAFIMCAEALADPLSPYYLTAGDNGMNWVVQGNAVINSWSQQHPENLGEYAIAVASHVRTLGNGNPSSRHPGSEYTLAGIYTGTDFPYPVANAAFYDGATDGTHNYSVDYESGGGVYQFDADWTNPNLLFSVPPSYLGITYDATNDSLWLSQFGGSIVANYSLSGTLLSSFVTSLGSITALALDPADNTLWMGSQGTQGTFYQYSKAGVQLDTVFYASLQSQNTLGGEFRLVPEPASLFLGLTAVALIRHRKPFSIRAARV